MRRTHLRGHRNILKRLLVHVGGFNLGLLMRTIFGVGTPRGLQGRVAALWATLWVILDQMPRPAAVPHAFTAPRTAVRGDLSESPLFIRSATCTTGC
jgi:hypothetical protein